MILFVGEPGDYLIKSAKDYFSNAELFDQYNYKTYKLPVGYTSVEEFSNESSFLEALHLASEIFYCPSSDHVSRKYTEFLLALVNQSIPVNNLKENLLGGDSAAKFANTCLEVVDVRKSNTPQIWTAGCSFTYGSGVSIDKRFTNLISEQLSIPTSCLAIPAGTIGWAADQILRSDIKKDDIVIWGLTNKQRLTWLHDGKVRNFTIGAYDELDWLERVLPKRIMVDEDNSTYQFLTHIHQVNNFCNKVGAKLLLVGLLTGPGEILYLESMPNFYQYFNTVYEKHNLFIDIGTDNKHPGPLQHQHYADEIIKQLQKRSWI